MYSSQQPHSLSASQRSLSPPPSPFIASSSPTDPNTYYSEAGVARTSTGAAGESRGMEFGSQPTGTSGVGGVPLRKRSGISSVRDEEKRKEVAKVDQIIQVSQHIPSRLSFPIKTMRLISGANAGCHSLEFVALLRQDMCSH